MSGQIPSQGLVFMFCRVLPGFAGFCQVLSRRKFASSFPLTVKKMHYIDGLVLLQGSCTKVHMVRALLETIYVI